MSKKLIYSISLFLLLLCMGCVTIYNSATGKKEVYFISEKTEIMIGRSMAQNILQSNKIITEKKLLIKLDDIGQRIGQLSDRPKLKYYFHVVDDESLNAFALPGGYVFVNKGLIDKVNDDELAFVLGHEIGHISARHSLKRLQASLGVSLLLNIALRNPDYVSINRAIGIVYNVVSLGYSRSDELLADSLGVKYIYRVGYDPKAAISLFNKMQKEEKGGRTLVFLSSHPNPETRIKNINSTLKNLKSP